MANLVFSLFLLPFLLFFRSSTCYVCGTDYSGETLRMVGPDQYICMFSSYSFLNQQAYYGVPFTQYQADRNAIEFILPTDEFTSGAFDIGGSTLAITHSFDYHYSCHEWSFSIDWTIPVSKSFDDLMERANGESTFTWYPTQDDLSQPPWSFLPADLRSKFENMLYLGWAMNDEGTDVESCLLIIELPEIPTSLDRYGILWVDESAEEHRLATNLPVDGYGTPDFTFNFPAAVYTDQGYEEYSIQACTGSLPICWCFTPNPSSSSSTPLMQLSALYKNGAIVSGQLLQLSEANTPSCYSSVYISWSYPTGARTYFRKTSDSSCSSNDIQEDQTCVGDQFANAISSCTEPADHYPMTDYHFNDPEATCCGRLSGETENTDRERVMNQQMKVTSIDVDWASPDWSSYVTWCSRVG